ncbi:hypothetical protein TNCV_3934971 [Trichonephila clavipes]|nr:hypothetical protein TNCV_3934971 [Trichonephila clavipes]
MPPDGQCQIEAYEIHRKKELDVRPSFSVALSTMQVTEGLGLTTIFREDPLGGGQEPPISFPLPPISKNDLRLEGSLKYPHAKKALCIYKLPWLLRDSIPRRMAQQSTSLTTIPEE